MDCVSSWYCEESESPGDVSLRGTTIVPAIRLRPSFDGDEPPGLSMLFASDRSGRVMNNPVATTLDLSTASSVWIRDQQDTILASRSLFRHARFLSSGLRISVAELLSAGLSVGPENKSQRKSAAKPTL